MGKIALCIIATGRYNEFVGPLLDSADEYFLSGREVHYHVFTDVVMGDVTFNIPFGRKIIYHKIKHEAWPMMTLKRYHFISYTDFSSYEAVFYCDADMLFVDYVGEEIIKPLVGVLHPGYYKGGGSWETRRISNAFVLHNKRKQYLAGGFQGGIQYWTFAGILKQWIDLDLSKNVIPVWHDESFWNWLYASYPENFTVLTPDYCMVEEESKRKAWGIDHFEPKLLALSKNHKEYQK